MILDFIEIGEIVGTHGVKGEMRVNPWADSPEFMKNFKTLYLDKHGQKSVKVSGCRPHGNVVLLMLDGIETVEQASVMRGKTLYMKRSDANLEKGNYFVQELVGCKVIDAETEKSYGIMSQVSFTGANDVWHIKDGEKEFLIPAIPDVVDAIDVEKGIITIHPLRGIFEDED
ncbi:MAG: ribosome maturation factor RimM [Oscillospiraceae bacterium]